MDLCPPLLNMKSVGERGTDYPFPLREDPPGTVIDALHNIRSEEREAMLGQNALRFLGRSWCYVYCRNCNKTFNEKTLKYVEMSYLTIGEEVTVNRMILLPFRRKSLYRRIKLARLNS